MPLLGPTGAVGVLTLERLGDGTAFDEQEFELVKLFAAQVSIALRNAEIFQAAEVRARTDDLTGLLNHRTFKDWLARSVADGEPFGPGDGRPRRVQGRQRLARPPGRRPAAARDRRRHARRRARHRRRVPLRRRRVRAGPAADRRRRAAGGRGAHPRRGGESVGGSGRAGVPRACVVARVHRDGVLPGRRVDRGGRAARRGPCLLRRQARRPGPRRDRIRGPRAGRRVHPSEPTPVDPPTRDAA